MRLCSSSHSSRRCCSFLIAFGIIQVRSDDRSGVSDVLSSLSVTSTCILFARVISGLICVLLTIVWLAAPIFVGVALKLIQWPQELFRYGLARLSLAATLIGCVEYSLGLWIARRPLRIVVPGANPYAGRCSQKWGSQALYVSRSCGPARRIRSAVNEFHCLCVCSFRHSADVEQRYCRSSAGSDAVRSRETWLRWKVHQSSLRLLLSGLFRIPLRRTNGFFQFLWALVYLAPAVLFSGLLARRAGRDTAAVGLSPRASGLWLAGTLLIGLPAYVTYRLMRPKAALTLCRECRLARRVDKDLCHHCGKGWNGPQLDPPEWRIVDNCRAGTPAEG